jgi:lysophospholipid acyltransferase (LPLAT)-like uncharacterized protein
VSEPDRSPGWLGPATAVGAVALRLLGGSWRLDRTGLEAYDEVLGSGGRCIFALWHARMLPLIFTHRGRGVGVLVSRSRDGRIIAGIVERMGYRVAHGSSSRGARSGVLEMLELSEQGRSLTITPDGPRGPAGVVKPGLVFLASRTGLPVLPVSSAARDAWVLRSWDRLRVPRPFSRVVVAYGDPIAVPPGLDERGAETWRVRIEQALHALTADVARRAGEPA